MLHTLTTATPEALLCLITDLQICCYTKSALACSTLNQRLNQLITPGTPGGSLITTAPLAGVVRVYTPSTGLRTRVSMVQTGTNVAQTSTFSNIQS